MVPRWLVAVYRMRGLSGNEISLAANRIYRALSRRSTSRHSFLRFFKPIEDDVDLIVR